MMFSCVKNYFSLKKNNILRPTCQKALQASMLTLVGIVDLGCERLFNIPEPQGHCVTLWNKWKSVLVSRCNRFPHQLLLCINKGWPQTWPATKGRTGSVHLLSFTYNQEGKLEGLQKCYQGSRNTSPINDTFMFVSGLQSSVQQR